MTVLNLYAGSTTGKVTTGDADDVVSLYSGRVNASAITTTYADAVSAATSSITLQAAGTLASAVVAAVDLGAGANTLRLKGAGDGPAANGAPGLLDVSTVSATGGAFSLAKADGGTWFVTGAATSSFSGGTTIDGGILGVADAAALGSGAVVDNAALVFSGVTGAVANAISGTGYVVVSGSGDLRLTGAVTLSGATVLSGGVLGVDASTYTSAISVKGGTLRGTGTTSAAVSVSSGGVFAPGEGGTGTFATSGALTLSAGATLAVTAS